VNSENLVYPIASALRPCGAGLWATSAGRLTGDKGWHNEIIAPMWIPHLIIDGTGWIETEHGRWNLSAGDMFCLWPDIRTVYEATTPWRFYWLQWAGEGAAACLNQCGFSELDTVRRPRRPRQAQAIFEHIWRGLHGGAALNGHAVVARLYSLVEVCGFDAPHPVPAEAGAALVDRARTLIGAMLDRAINISELSDHLGVDRTTLYHAFRQVLNVTPMAYLTRARLDRARQLLQQTDLKMSVIAQACGFRNEKYFLRRFHAQEAMTPGAFRAARPG